MTPLYAGIGGVVRELTEMDAGIGGVVKPMTEMWAGVGGAQRQIFSAGKQMGSLSVGDIIQLNEDGAAEDYICVHQGLPSELYDDSCDGTWLLRNLLLYPLTEWNFTDSSVLETSTIQTWLNTTMLNTYDQNVQEAIKQVKIPYRRNGGASGENAYGANGLSCKVFLLSGYELGWTQSNFRTMPIDGSKLDYFESGTGSTANSKRIAYREGSSSGLNWWTRTPATQNDALVWYVNYAGSAANNNASRTNRIRPCVIFPKNFIIPGGNV